MKLKQSIAIISASLAAALIPGDGASQTAALPNPDPLSDQSNCTAANGQSFIRYRYDVFNKEPIPPRCSRRRRPAALRKPIGQALRAPGSTSLRLSARSGPNVRQDLGSIWFALPEGQLPPCYVYIEITDRQTNTKYRSNLADTTL